MAGNISLKTHPSWLDWIGIGLGAIIGLTPWFTNYAADGSLPLITMMIGVLVLALSSLELVQLSRWEESVEIACGVWLASLPFIYGYADAGSLRYWHFLLGTAVVLIALFELWHDWHASDEELARHGQ